MNKKGFTLIELLAVIVILAIIAAIAIPIVLNIISDLRKDSTEISMKNIEKAANLYYQENYNEENIVFECSNNKCNFNNKELELNGKVPESGKILIDKSGNITYEDLVLNGFNCYKEHDKFVCDTKKIRKIYKESEIVIDSKSEYSLFDYNIYGNSVQKSKLPNEYQLVEYINGIQTYVSLRTTSINLNCFWKDISKINLKMQFLTLSNDNHGSMLFKSTTNGSDGVSPFIYSGTDGIVFNGINGSVTNNYTKEELTNNGLKELEILIDDNTISSSIYFGAWVDGAYSKNWQLESLKIYDTKDKLIRNLVPCYRKSDNVIGMYDLVNDVFYTNAGNGEFVKGNDISTPETLLKFESVGEYDEATGKYKIPVTVSGQNLFDINKTEKGWLDSTTGKITTSNEFTTDYIPLDYNQNVYVYNEKGAKWAAWGVVYDKNFNPILPYVPKESGKIDNFLIKNPYENGKYIRFTTGYSTYLSPEKLETTRISYVEPIKTNIYLDEPLRKVGEKADYIDFKNQKVLRYIEEDNEGNLKVLSVPKEEKIELPKILLHDGINNIEIGTSIKPSKIELEYFK